MKKILFLTPELQSDFLSGGIIKTNKIIEFLSESNNSLEIISLRGNGFKLSDQHKITCLDQKLKSRNLLTFCGSLIVGKPLSIYRQISQDINSFFKNLFEFNNYDYIIVDHFLMFEFLASHPLRNSEIIYHAHNAEFLMWKRHSENFRFPLKTILKFESKRIKNYENVILKKAKHIIAAPNDIEIFKKLNPLNNYYNTYHLANEEFLEMDNLEFSKTKENLLFIGKLDWEANNNGLLWFLLNVWPIVKRKNPEVKLNIVGKGASDELIEVAAKDSSIKLLGYVTDLEKFFHSTRVFICPLLFGSGIKVKVIESMYRGIPCVSTSIGTEGLEVKNGEQIFITDEVNQFAAYINILLTNESKWKLIRNNCRVLVKEKYTWTEALRPFEIILNS